MNKYLFDLPYKRFEPGWTIRSYVDLTYNDDHFLDSVENILIKVSYILDGIYCNFPDMNSYDKLQPLRLQISAQIWLVSKAASQQ